MRLPFTLLALASSYCSTLALDLKGQIFWNDACPGIDHLGQARVVLDNGRLNGGITRDGGFVIPNVPSGTYVLSVVAHDHAFDKLRVDVLETDTLPEIRPYIPGTPLNPPSHITLPYPITFSARGKYDFYVPRQSFNLIAMFQNPMMLMMVFTGVMVLAMPYLMKNMDPESLQDFSKRQSKFAEIQSSLQSGDLKSGLSAIMGGADEPRNGGSERSSVKQSTQNTVKNRTPKGKRR